MSTFNQTAFNMGQADSPVLLFPQGDVPTYSFPIDSFTAIKSPSFAFPPQQFRNFFSREDRRRMIIGDPVSLSATEMIIGIDNSTSPVIERPIIGILIGILIGNNNDSLLVQLPAGSNIITRVADEGVTRGDALAKSISIPLANMAGVPSGVIIHSNAIALSSAAPMEKFSALVSPSVLYSIITN